MTDKLTAPPYVAMLEQSPDSLIFADCDGIIRYWNVASVALFGFSADEALGQSLDIIIPEHLRPPHWRGFNAAISSGTTKHGGKPTRTKALHRDGSHLYAQISFSLITDDSGRVLGSLSSARACQ